MPQLDHPTAAKRLIAAASLYGAEAVANCAEEFAAHGLIEFHTVYLLKGPPITQEVRLDDYCALVPYREGRRRIDETHAGPLMEGMRWPAEQDSNVCALVCRSFERRGPRGYVEERYASPLMKFGRETLALVLGLVWGNGLRVFGDWPFVPMPIGETLPFPDGPFERGGGLQRVELPPEGYGPEARQRPVPTEELAVLMASYAGLPEQVQRVLDLAMRRLRDSAERAALEDKVIDLSIALEALFMEEDEEHDYSKRIPGRASWHYADSSKEREATRCLLKSFYKLRGRTVHGRVPGKDEWSAANLENVGDVLRASLKDMIRGGRPENWEESKDAGSIRHDPPRANSEIPSVKSDSLSWSVAEQWEIDRALSAAWTRTVKNVHPPSGGRRGGTWLIAPTEASLPQSLGRPYIIMHPALLYMAHPKWPKKPSDPLDERTEYYCEQDVVKHVRAWQEEATRKGLDCVHMEADAALYHPKDEKNWRFWPVSCG